MSKGLKAQRVLPSASSSSSSPPPPPSLPPPPPQPQQPTSSSKLITSIINTQHHHHHHQHNHHNEDSGLNEDIGQQQHDSDLFSFLSNMHLSSSNSAIIASPHHGNQQSRKRKILDHSSGKNLLRGSRNNEAVDTEDGSHALHTPQCSQAGYADEEDQRNNLLEEQQRLQLLRNKQPLPLQQQPPAASVLSPVNPALLSEIDENLAANFDDSLSGLGVDISTVSSYNISEALLALPNLSISNPSAAAAAAVAAAAAAAANNQQPHIFKQEVPSPTHGNKNYGALDLSNEDPILSTDEVVKTPPTPPPLPKADATNPVAVTTSTVSTVTTNGGQQEEENFNSYVLGGSHPNLSLIGNNGNRDRRSSNPSPTHKVILPLTSSVQQQQQQQHVVKGEDAATRVDKLNDYDLNESNGFEYVMKAATSIATKAGGPSITYLNQGQPYKIRLKKLGDVSAYRKKLLKCIMRICFHERRLQYSEAEHIAEWSQAHKGERILDMDVTMNYGIIDPVRDPNQLNVLSFKWDPTRDTGIYIKVNCISTEFTPKKHGGEKGVPFRLQVETYEDAEDGGRRLHAAGCILQVFKLKGADRKHRQDREKISKRPPSEQEKFALPCESTVLTDLPIDDIYIPPVTTTTTTISTSSTSEAVEVTPLETVTNYRQQQELITTNSSRDVSPAVLYNNHNTSDPSATTLIPMPMTTPMPTPSMPPPKDFLKQSLPLSASPEEVSLWLSANRYGDHLTVFRNYNGRDMLRLMREEIMSLMGEGAASDAVRLYNDLHMIMVPPRTTFYVAQKTAEEYSALFLEEYTVEEFVKRLAASIGVTPSIFSKIYLCGPHGILIRVTDSVVQYMKPETIFHFTLRYSNNETGTCDVILEEVSSAILNDPQPELNGVQ